MTSFYESTPSTEDPLGRSNQGPEEVLGMREQISLMLQKNVITEVSPNSPGFYSNVFLVRKASGGLCPVIDLKSLNAHIHAPEHSPSGFYSVGAHGDRLPPPSGDLGYSLSGRLAGPPSRPSSLVTILGPALRDARPGRLTERNPSWN